MTFLAPYSTHRHLGRNHDSHRNHHGYHQSHCATLIAIIIAIATTMAIIKFIATLITIIIAIATTMAIIKLIATLIAIIIAIVTTMAIIKVITTLMGTKTSLKTSSPPWLSSKFNVLFLVLDFPLGAPNTLLKHVIERSIWRIVVGEGSWWGWGFSQDW